MSNHENLKNEEMGAPLIRLPVRQVMETSYLDYAMSVITERALPDVRDGLKPVHRRILHAMHNLKIGPQSAYKKSARVTGEVIGKYHPHGDSAVYEAAVRLAQPWSLLHPLVDGQGNFGSIDGDNPAAMRYTEMRMTQMSYQMFNDIEKETVRFIENYDGSEQEPEVLPLAFPNLWVNGGSGIAVGMASNVPPHCLEETQQAFMAWLEDEEVPYSELVKIMPAPDFPTGGLIHGLDGYQQALETGRGRIKLRARHHIEELPGKRKGDRIVVTEIPYQVNKSVLTEKIGELIKERKIEGITDLRDESNKKGIRIVIETRADADAESIMLQLVKMTDLEVSVHYNVRALVRSGKGRDIFNEHGELVGQEPTPAQPKLLSVKEVFAAFRDHRIEVIEARTRYDLKKTKARLHVLAGYLSALDRLDDTIKTIRAAEGPADAKESLIKLLWIDAIQAQAILELRLQRLTGLQVKEIQAENDRLRALSQDLQDILDRPERQQAIMIEELNKAVTTFARPRCSEVAHGLSEITREDLIPEEEVLLLATENGYLKRLPSSAIKQQNRGSKGRSIMDVGEDDMVTAIHSGSTHDYLMAITQFGQVHAVKAYQVPETKIGNKGRHYRNIFEGMDDQAHVVAMLSCKEFNDRFSLVMMTEQGRVKRSGLSQYRNSTRAKGVIGIDLQDGDRIISAEISESDDDRIVMISSRAKALHFELSTIRQIGRTGMGVCGMKLKPEDRLIQACVVKSSEINQTDLVCVGENGVGKRTPVTDLMVHGRCTQGQFCFKESARTGPLAAASLITPGHDLILFNDEGGANRIKGDDIAQTSRATSGSILMKNGLVRRLITVPENPDQPIITFHYSHPGWEEALILTGENHRSQAEASLSEGQPPELLEVKEVVMSAEEVEALNNPS